MFMNQRTVKLLCLFIFVTGFRMLICTLLFCPDCLKVVFFSVGSYLDYI